MKRFRILFAVGLLALLGSAAVTTTPGIRLFWHRQLDAFTWWDAKHQNPIGAVQTFGSAPIVRPKVTYAIQDPTLAQLKANRAAIQEAINSLPDNGGTLLISGSCQYWGTINFPRRVFVPQAADRPIPLEIAGESSNAELINYEASPAVSFTSGYSYQVGSTVAKGVLRDLSVYSKGKGVVVNGGGKEFKIRNCVISTCEDTAFEQTGSFDGGVVDDVYCINNKKDGAHFDSAHECSVTLTCRGNGGSGLVVTNSNSWSLWYYGEANAGYGIDATNCKLIRGTIWQEANRGPDKKYEPQGRLKFCQMELTGQSQQDSNNAFEMDGFSRLNVTFPKTPASKYEPFRVQLPWPPANPLPYPNGHPMFDRSFAGGEMKLTVKAGAYSNQPDPITSNWLSLDPPSWIPETRQRLLNEGDVVVYRMQVRASPEAAKFYAGLTNTPMFKVTMDHPALSDGEQLFIRDVSPYELEICAPCVRTAQGDLRILTYVCPVRLPPISNPITGTTTPRPIAAHDLFITGRQMYVIPAK